MKYRINRHSEIGLLKIELDKLFRQAILKERGERCQWCGKSGIVHVAHLLPKGKYPRLRYVKENVALLCYHCHLHKFHKNPLEAFVWVSEKFGEKHIDYLKHNIEPLIGKHTKLWLYGMIQHYKNLLEGKETEATQ